MEEETKINLKDYKYVVAFSNQTECYLCEDMDAVNTCIKSGLEDTLDVEAYVLTFNKYKTATYKINYEG